MSNAMIFLILKDETRFSYVPFFNALFSVQMNFLPYDDLQYSMNMGAWRGRPPPETKLITYSLHNFQYIDLGELSADTYVGNTRGM